MRFNSSAKLYVPVEERLRAFAVKPNIVVQM